MATVIDATELFKKSIGYTPLCSPPAWLTGADAMAWHDILAASSPGVLWATDGLYVGIVAVQLAAYRHDKKPSRKRVLRKMMNRLLLPRSKITALLAD